MAPKRSRSRLPWAPNLRSRAGRLSAEREMTLSGLWLLNIRAVLGQVDIW